MLVETNIIKRILEIISRNFGPMPTYHKIFNRKPLKISYSCMPNMKSQIMSYNRNMLEDKAEKWKQSNCRDKCMVDGNCLIKNVIYRATVIELEKSKQYVWSSGLSLKRRCTWCNCSFNKSNYRLKTIFQNVFEVLKIEIKILARTKNEFNFKHGCTLCNIENHEISKLI